MRLKVRLKSHFYINSKQTVFNFNIRILWIKLQKKEINKSLQSY